MPHVDAPFMCRAGWIYADDSATLYAIMEGSRHSYRVIRGHTRGVRGPDALELVFVVAVILACVVLVMPAGRHARHVVKTLEAVYLAGAAIEDNLVLYRSVYGRWPSAANEAIVDLQGGRSTRSIELVKNGGLIVKVGWKTDAASSDETLPVAGILSFKHAVISNGSYKAVILLCGGADNPVPQAHVVGPSQTTLKKYNMPGFCW